MTLMTEMERISADAVREGRNLLAKSVVEAARDATQFPELNKHLWQVDSATLEMEARLGRAHRLIIRMRVTSVSGDTVRAFMHLRTERGYRQSTVVAGQIDLARIKLNEMMADIGRARQRLASFRAILPDDIATEIQDALDATEAKMRSAVESRAEAA